MGSTAFSSGEESEKRVRGNSGKKSSSRVQKQSFSKEEFVSCLMGFFPVHIGMALLACVQLS